MMPSRLLPGLAPSEELSEAYARQAGIVLGGSPAYQRLRLAAAWEFLQVHPDLDEWMDRPLDARLVELGRRPLAWQLVGFAILTQRCQADIDFLAAKHFGHSVARWTTALFPAECERQLAAGSARQAQHRESSPT